MSHRYFTDRIEGSRAFLTGEEAAHLARVLRAAPGDAVTLCDGAGTDYAAQVVRAAPDEVELAIISSAPSVSEPPLAVTLFVGMPKGDKLEWIIQKSTELGAAEICPFTSRFCIAKPKNEQVKLTRWNRIAREAAKQSGRGRVPAVGGAVSFDALCERIPDYDLATSGAARRWPPGHRYIAGWRRRAASPSSPARRAVFRRRRRRRPRRPVRPCWGSAPGFCGARRRRLPPSAR